MKDRRHASLGAGAAFRLIVLVLAAVALIGARGAEARPADWVGVVGKAGMVDLKLVLLMDISTSVSGSEYRLQRDGLAAALRHPSVVGAIESARGIAIAVAMFSGKDRQVLAANWRILRGARDAEALAGGLEELERPENGGGTAIGNAIGYAIRLLAGSGPSAVREVIDVSGDGPSNTEGAPGPMRDRAVAAGITVNGLVIRDKQMALPNYYRAYVVGGPGSFVMVANDFHDYARAIRLKLLREIGGAALSLNAPR